MPKSSTLQPANIANLKESAPAVPKNVMFFYRLLPFCLTLSKAKNSLDTVQRKANALASVAEYNVRRGSVRPWKSPVLGLGISTITGSKLAVQILNRRSQCINYSEVKALKIKLVFTAAKDDRENRHGIKFVSNFKYSLRMGQQ